MNTCSNETGPFEIVRFTRELAATRPILRQGEALGIGGPGNVCDVRLELLSAFEHIWGLHVTESSIFELSQLRRWPGLKYLAIDGDGCLLDLSGFAELEWLIVHWVNHHKLPPPSAPLRRFAVWKLPDDDLGRIPAWSDLRILELVRGRAVSLAGIERFQRLEHLGMIQMRRLCSVGALTACPSFRSLYLEACTHIEDLTALQGCRSLRTLVLARCGEIESLSFLDDMAPLDSVRLVGTRVRDGDMTPLRRMRHAVFDYHRGYSHREHEIARMIWDANAT